ncbi:MAG: hypothetical protein WD795_17015 [Woeseia sp.]
MDDIARMAYLAEIIRQSPDEPKARNAVWLLRQVYEQQVGYDPMADDPTMTPAQLAELAGGYAAEYEAHERGDQ